MTCPKCGKKVKELYYLTTEHNTYVYDGYQYYPKDSYVESDEYICIHCGAVVATAEEDANKILKDD